jgi:Tfp pilus assembly protein PilO
VTSLSDRDRKLMLALVPIIVIAAYWFLLLSPKMKEADVAAVEVTEQQERRDAAQAAVDQATSAQGDFAADYGEVVRLGKAIPAKVDMPSLLVQLDRAAEGTDISFTRISTGDRTAATTTTTTTPAPSDSTTTPTDAGGTAAQSAPGQATESANDAAATSDQRNDAAESSGVDPADTQTSTSSGSGLPVGGGAAGTTAGPAPAPAALETVPLELEFVGNFFSLADFFHDIKRFVHVLNEDVVVNGRLVTIEGVTFSSDQTIFPRIKAELAATVYLSPAAQGETAGATPAGPSVDPTTPAGTTPTEDGASPAPVATATPR